MLALLTLTLLVKSVLSVPVTPSVLENDDVKVMKCVVEALADVLSRPRPLPVSEQCLQTLRTDERLQSLLRHYDFLKELQDVATHGDRKAPEGGAMAPNHATPSLESPDSIPDGSMLTALGGPGEHSILSQERRRSDEVEEENNSALWLAGEKREEEDPKKAWASGEMRRSGSKEEQDKRSAEEEEEENDNEEGMKKRSKSQKEGKEEAPHHSKEVLEDEELKKKKRNRSPEEKELQMIARRTPDEEDGSAARKAEDTEVENLATIESELENVAHKLRQLREG
ncbi:chromogranin-A [Corythoichthys intestinalis]|uniref:chromogranin-A n=1 Tax=Corythoichthys intestinalis TaxID=161448 RepID=UPI0025A5B809|nr:chromogranin-A [Corythoichthys intestinalis]